MSGMAHLNRAWNADAPENIMAWFCVDAWPVNEDTSCANDLARWNMPCMPSHFEEPVFHFPMAWLNCSAPSNWLTKLSTFDVSQSEMSWLKLIASLNMPCMVFALLVFHLEMSALNAALPLNMPWKLSTFETSQFEMSELNNLQL